jgi:hypothetical protein
LNFFLTVKAEKPNRFVEESILPTEKEIMSIKLWKRAFK